MISELLLASRSDALAYASHPVETSLPKLEANTVDTIKLASLALILNGKELLDDDVIAFANGFKDVAYQREDGPWLYVCPRDFRLDLAKLSPDRVLEIAKAWAATEEAQLDHWTVTDTEEFLKVLSQFCAQTSADDSDLFLFVSL